jgi:hypothetical protein
MAAALYVPTAPGSVNGIENTRDAPGARPARTRAPFSAEAQVMNEEVRLMADSKEGVVAPVPIFCTVTLPVTDFPGVPLGTENAVVMRSVVAAGLVT